MRGPSATEPLISVQHLHVRFPIRKGLLQRAAGHFEAVAGISFDIHPGKTLALVGESGCGKTTTGKAIVQLLRGHADITGRALLGGTNLFEMQGATLQAARRDIQIIFQDPFSSLNPRMRVFDILEEGLLSLQPDLTSPERRSRLETLADQVGLRREALERFPHEFSGGQRQRLKDLSAGLTLTLRDLCHLMTALSDNTATDLLLDTLGLEGVNRRLESLGFEHTRLRPQHAAPGSGGRPPLAVGVTTPAEMARLLRAIVQSEVCSEASSGVILGMLGAQHDRSMIPRFLPPHWTYAGKTGSNEDLRADVGLVTDPQGRRFVLALYCRHDVTADWSVESRGTLSLARLARNLLAAP